MSDNNELIVQTKEAFQNYEQNEASTAVSHFMDLALILLCQTSDTSTLVSIKFVNYLHQSLTVTIMLRNDTKLTLEIVYCIQAGNSS